MAHVNILHWKQSSETTCCTYFAVLTHALSLFSVWRWSRLISKNPPWGSGDKTAFVAAGTRLEIGLLIIKNTHLLTHTFWNLTSRGHHWFEHLNPEWPWQPLGPRDQLFVLSKVTSIHCTGFFGITSIQNAPEVCPWHVQPACVSFYKQFPHWEAVWWYHGKA